MGGLSDTDPLPEREREREREERERERGGERERPPAHRQHSQALWPTLCPLSWKEGEIAGADSPPLSLTSSLLTPPFHPLSLSITSSLLTPPFHPLSLSITSSLLTPPFYPPLFP